MKRGAARVPAALLAGLLAAHASAEQVRLEPRGVEGKDLVVGVVASDLHAVGSVDLTVHFDPEQVAAPNRQWGKLTSGAMVLDNTSAPGVYRLALIAPNGVSGEGDIALLRFPLRTPDAALRLGLDGKLTDLDGAPISVQLEDARVEPEVARPEPPPSAPAAEASSASGAGSHPTDPPAAPDAAPAADRAASDASIQTAPTNASSQPTPTKTEAVEPAGRTIDGRSPKDPELVREDRAARIEGYRMWVTFEPKARFAEAGPTPIEAQIRLFRREDVQPLQPGQIKLTGKAIEVKGMSVGPDGSTVNAELVIDPQSLPARLEVAMLGLHEIHLVPVHPRVDADLDGSGTLDLRDYNMLVPHLGTRRGEPLYEERFDLARDGVIDEADAAALWFNLIETERARRLARLQAEAKAGAR